MTTLPTALAPIGLMTVPVAIRWVVPLVDRPSLLPNVKGTINLRDLTAELSYKDLGGELTAAENMELHGVLYRVPRGERRARVEALLRFVGLWERRHDYVKRFSGGMKRRLEIARALQHRP
ncbi:MAG TPA: ATP-binding cassette domain-containing protein, partial [Stellaceae bacterium]|nr:ATP-binding cassette domain-containing protein [Stellaceae bacterium]